MKPWLCEAMVMWSHGNAKPWLCGAMVMRGHGCVIKGTLSLWISTVSFFLAQDVIHFKELYMDMAGIKWRYLYFVPYL